MAVPHGHLHGSSLNHKKPGDGLISVAFWQLMTFFMLILLVWLNELMDLAALWFGTPPNPPSIFRGCVLTIGTIVVAVVTVGHTYLQQKQIISGLLTVCSSCRRIRVDEELWEQLDEYIADHSVALISHGLCPHCFKAMQQEISALGLHATARDQPPDSPPTGAA